MGFLATDLAPISSTGPTVLIPTSKDTVCKVFSVARTDTTATLKAVLPADASIIGVKVFGGTASNAGTSATVTITAANNSGTVSTGTYDVKTNGAVTGEITMSGLPNIQPVPLTGDITIKATYAETGTASSAGGAWNVMVTYIR
jgi:ATP-dependent Lon protease